MIIFCQTQYILRLIYLTSPLFLEYNLDLCKFYGTWYRDFVRCLFVYEPIRFSNCENNFSLLSFFFFISVESKKNNKN